MLSKQAEHYSYTRLKKFSKTLKTKKNSKMEHANKKKIAELFTTHFLALKNSGINKKTTLLAPRPQFCSSQTSSNFFYVCHFPPQNLLPQNCSKIAVNCQKRAAIAS